MCLEDVVLSVKLVSLFQLLIKVTAVINVKFLSLSGLNELWAAVYSSRQTDAIKYRIIFIYYP